MIGDGLRLMVVGMVAVFGFLALLVLVMNASAAFFERFGDRFASADDGSGSGPGGPGADEDEAAIALALAVATTRRHRVGGKA